jgi:subtilisin-like proprotein convertase family protein
LRQDLDQNGEIIHSEKCICDPGRFGESCEIDPCASAICDSSCTCTAYSYTASNGTLVTGAFCDCPTTTTTTTSTPSTTTLTTTTTTTQTTTTIPANIIISTSIEVGITNRQTSYSPIATNQIGSVRSLSVTINLSYSKLEQLVIYLLSPEGVAVVLRNKEAGTAVISTTYPTLTAPSESLNAFVNKSVTGVWNLVTFDTLAGQTGRISSWSLNISLNSYTLPTSFTQLNFTTSTNVNTIVNSSLNVNFVARVVSVIISVNIAQVKQQDLRVAIISPTGVSVLLHNRNGGNQGDLIETFPLTVPPQQSLNAFNGLNVNGNWVLSVQNFDSRAAILRSWSLALYHTP